MMRIEQQIVINLKFIDYLCGRVALILCDIKKLVWHDP